MGLISLIVLVISLALSMRLGRQLSTPLLQLRVWLHDPDDPAPGSGRQDEIGDLARQLQARLVPEKPEPEPQHDDEERHVYTELDNEEHFIDEPDGREPGFTMPELHAATDYDEDLTRPAPHAAPTDDDPFAELRDMQAEMPPPTPAIDMPEPPEQRLSSAILAIQLGAQEQL